MKAIKFSTMNGHLTLLLLNTRVEGVCGVDSNCVSEVKFIYIWCLRE